VGANGLVEDLTQRQSNEIDQERRKHPRVRVGCPAYATPLDDKFEKVADAYVVVVRDISDGGIALFFLSSRPFPYEFMRVDIPVGDVMLRAVAEVLQRDRSDCFHEVAGRFLARLENVPFEEIKVGDSEDGR
jgi:hypothetical protein